MNLASTLTFPQYVPGFSLPDVGKHWKKAVALLSLSCLLWTSGCTAGSSYLTILAGVTAAVDAGLTSISIADPSLLSPTQASEVEAWMTSAESGISATATELKSADPALTKTSKIIAIWQGVLAQAPKGLPTLVQTAIASVEAAINAFIAATQSASAAAAHVSSQQVSSLLAVNARQLNSISAKATAENARIHTVMSRFNGK